jgi:RNA polymerase sigma factor (sigma-70 family)
MDEQAALAERFEQHRKHLRGVATRILGSAAEADDAVQETWVRFSRSDTSDVENLAGWLTTVVSRVCLTMLEGRHRHAELPLVDEGPEPDNQRDADSDPEQAVVLADTVGLALLVVLDSLSPSERVAFVLHDIFGLSFSDIASILDRSPAATRQMASRARRRVRGQQPSGAPDRMRQAELVAVFLDAARRGDMDALVAVLDPDLELRPDRTAVSWGAPAGRGATEGAAFLRRARGALAALVDGEPGAVWIDGGQLRVVFSFTVGGDSITAVDLIADPDRITQIDLVVLDDPDADGSTRQPG